MVELKHEQRAFLAECEHDFAHRYTMEDEEFKAIYDSEIPAPPVMSNWYPRNKRNSGGGRGSWNRDFRRDGRDRSRDNRDNRYNNRHDYGRNYDRGLYEDTYREREVRDRPRYND